MSAGTFNTRTGGSHAPSGVEAMADRLGELAGEVKGGNALTEDKGVGP